VPSSVFNIGGLAVAEKKKISAKEISADIKSGMTNADLMAKYHLSAQDLKKIRHKLKALGITDESDRPQVVKKPIARHHPGQRCPSCDFPLADDDIECPRCGIVISKVIAADAPSLGSAALPGDESSGYHAAYTGVLERPQRRQITSDQTENDNHGGIFYKIRQNKIWAIVVVVVLIVGVGYGVDLFMKASRMKTYKKILADCKDHLSMESQEDFESSLNRLKRLIAVTAGTVKGRSWSEDEVGFMIRATLDETERFYDLMREISQDGKNIYGSDVDHTYSMLYDGLDSMVASIRNQRAKQSVRIMLTSRGHITLGKGTPKGKKSVIDSRLHKADYLHAKPGDKYVLHKDTGRRYRVVDVHPGLGLYRVIDPKTQEMATFTRQEIEFVK
jgi:hypothetical protein